jgi:hypothetical protein
MSVYIARLRTLVWSTSLTGQPGIIDLASPYMVGWCSLYSLLLTTSLPHDMADLKMVSLALLAAVTLPAVAVELPTGVIAVPLSRDPEQTAYYAEFKVGTPPQKERLKIDTGSPMFSFLDPRNRVCGSQDCKSFGTFDNTTSAYVPLSHMVNVVWIVANCELCRTCHYEGPGFYDYLSVLGNGDYLNDTLVLGGVTIEKMYFGYTSSYIYPNRVTGNVATILGMRFIPSS